MDIDQDETDLPVRPADHGAQRVGGSPSPQATVLGVRAEPGTTLGGTPVRPGAVLNVVRLTDQDLDRIAAAVAGRMHPSNLRDTPPNPPHDA